MKEINKVKKILDNGIKIPSIHLRSNLETHEEFKNPKQNESNWKFVKCVEHGFFSYKMEINSQQLG